VYGDQLYRPTREGSLSMLTLLTWARIARHLRSRGVAPSSSLSDTSNDRRSTEEGGKAA